jgi:hypothetical protein
VMTKDNRLQNGKNNKLLKELLLFVVPYGDFFWIKDS